MITVSELKSAISTRIQAYHDNYPLTARPVEQIATMQAQNHILAADVAASFDIPRQHISAMDGFALAVGSDLSAGSVFKVVGESCAGAPFMGELNSGQAVRIFTGAVLPAACDTVVMQEHTSYQKPVDEADAYDVSLTQDAKLVANIRRQGEEVQAGEVVLSAGLRITPADISLLMNLGVAEVLVMKPLTVGILATGDELVDVGKPLTTLAQIYNSNTPTLATLLAKLPIRLIDYGIIPDDKDATMRTVSDAIAACDVIISSAGVSVGDYDYLTEVVDALGQINHYKVLMKPGKPFVFGEFSRADGQAVLYFGLPGNPLSTIVGCLQFVRPALWQMSTPLASARPVQLTLSAICTADIHKKGGRQEFQRAHFYQADDGVLYVKPFGGQDSHRVKQLTHANCLLVLAADSRGVAAGEAVLIEPFDWALC